MPFDALFLTAVTAELQQALPGARVDKIQQPARDTVVLSLRSQTGNRKLLLSASPNHPRIHFTQARMENPAQPPMFCMLLRKHLAGGRVLGLTQPPLERAVDLAIESADEMGEVSVKHLYLELMGRNANLILADGQGRIIDCLRRVDFAMSEKRQVLPGLFYRQPPDQGKENPLAVSPEGLQALLARVTAPQRLSSWLLDTFAGLSPLVARELAFLAAGDIDADVFAADTAALSQALAQAMDTLCQSPQPVQLLYEGRPKDFSFRPITQYGAYYTQQIWESFSALLDAVYTQRDQAERMRSRAQALRKTVQNLHTRVSRKLALQEKERTAAANRERLRQLGDIVTANIHQMTRGQARLIATDFYDPEMKEITIPLQVNLSPQQNAAKFYKEYTKAKTAEKILTVQLEEGRREQTYLSSVLEALALAETEQDLADIRQELLEGGYVRDTDKRKRMKTAPAKPLAFTSADGFAIYVGRNNRQNDFLTGKVAHKQDLWFHAQKFHGSHVIVSCQGQTPPETTLRQAAALAAYYSQARQSQNVPVDYCPVRQVKKPHGAKPGMVVYENYNTIYVNPEVPEASS